MKNLKSLPAVIFLFISVVMNAQPGYKPGYIITLTNDTIRGKILFTSSQRNSEICCLETPESNKKKEYKPFEINGYRLNEGKYYISKRVPVYSDTLSLFVECIVQGRASFYYIEHKNTGHYYIATGDSFIELTEPEQIIDMGETKVFRQPKLYYGKLLYSLRDCPEIKPEIETINLNHKDLISLGQDYHRITCDSGECVVFERKFKSPSFTIGLISGYTISDFKIGASMGDESLQGCFTGITTNISNILANDERFSLDIEFLIQYNRTLNLSEHSSGVYDYVKYNGKTYGLYVKNRVEFNYPWVTSLKAQANLFALKIPVIPKYSFGNHKMHYSFGLGPVLSFTLSQNKSLKYFSSTEEYVNIAPAFLCGGILKCGLEYNIDTKTTVFTDISYDKIFIPSSSENIYHTEISTLSFRGGIRF